MVIIFVKIFCNVCNEMFIVKLKRNKKWAKNSSHVWTGKQERIGENIMMYNEFLEKTEMSKFYISWSEYTEMIEPIYMKQHMQQSGFY